MFRRRAKVRTYSHNRKIASLLSFVAGGVGVVGFMSIQKLVINATGNVVFFAHGSLQFNWQESITFFLYVFFFFAGSFVSNMLIEITAKLNERFIYIVPALIEISILFLVGLFGAKIMVYNADYLAFILLFAMGLQNALVTIISNAIVRTTHLSGLFTDLGIELSQLFFYKTEENKAQLIRTIRLRFRIIIYFVMGGVINGVLYASIHFKTYYILAILLLIGMFYDTIKFKILLWSKRNDIV